MRMQQKATARFEPIEFHHNEGKYLHSILLLIKSLTRAHGERDSIVDRLYLTGELNCILYRGNERSPCDFCITFYK